MEQARVVIVGGGVVGCAIAAELAARTSDVFVLEQMPRVGMLTSTRNSGVIHSGIYYTPGSLKAIHCVEGNRLTYEFCAAHDVPCKRTGKIVVATTPEEESELQALRERGRENGVKGLEMLSSAGLKAREPHIAGRAALWVPSTGLVESEWLVKAFAALAQSRGAYIATEARLERLEPQGDLVRAVATNVGEIAARVLVNAAGLFADEVAAMAGNNNYTIYPCRGEYWEVAPEKAHLVTGLVYPAPDPSGLSLGVHFTKTLWGTLLLGPNARYVERKDDYEHDLEPRESFCARAQKLLPQLQPDDLRPGYSGLRAKLAPPGHRGIKDFVVEPDPRFPQIIHLVGIESPGLTAAASLARSVAALAMERLH
ncbi:MAG TPA: NAD(P)/FAD-dependent oxidoreductase [Candidatus Xenobia bacterium]|nr:NAD(P)/FAD-dependent oxidoreductase [Candidatus Xenobia bacterium]